MVGAVEFPQIVGPAYTYPSWPIDCQESINFEPLPVESKDSPYRSMLVGTPGLEHLRFRFGNETIDDIPAGGDYPIRGLHRCMRGFGGDPDPATVVVAGKFVYQVKAPNADGVCELVRLMELPSPDSEWTSRVSMADGGGEPYSNFGPKLVIADGKFFHVIDMDNGTSEQVYNPPCSPDFVTFLDGRVYACGKDAVHGLKEGRVYWSAINDPSSWGGADFVSAAASNDPLQCVKAVSNYLWLIGTDTFEVWQTSATSGGVMYSPIRRVMGSADGVGTASGRSVATISNRIYFVGGGPTGHGRIYEGEGTRLHYISTDAMEQEFRRYNMENSFGFCYSDDGRAYYCVTFIDDDVTWVYCHESKSWHKRSSRTATNDLKRWCVGHTTYNFGMVIAGSLSSSRLYRMASDIYTEDGATILRKRVSPHIVTGPNFTRHASFTLDIETGTALEYGQGSEPQVMLQALDDGGRIKRGERWISTGRNGNYRKRVKWYRLGQARDRAYEITVSDPVRWVIYGARVEIEKQTGGL